MTVRVETLQRSVDSQGWFVPFVRTYSVGAVIRLLEWWRPRPSTLEMSVEWLQEFRRSTRSY